MNRESIASAPGRVNLIGEHTDYNDGFVLPLALPLLTSVRLTPRADRSVFISSDAYPDEGEQSYTLGEERLRGHWLDYAQAVTWVLAREGYAFSGFRARVTSTVPPGAGLASSAAFEVALLQALRAAFPLPLDDLTIATLGRAAENGFVGAQTGIMDQMAASLARPRTALFLDCRTLAYELIPLPEDAAILVLDSGIRHQHSAGAYNTRRAECAAAARLLGVASLRDATTAVLDRIAALPTPLDRRAHHVVTENARVLEAREALRRGDLARLGALMLASHASQRDNFAVSLPKIDQLVELASTQPGVYGARLTGGGWGGCVIALAEREQAATIAGRIAVAAGIAAWWIA